MASYIQKKREIREKTEELSTRFSTVYDNDDNSTLRKTLELVNSKLPLTSIEARNIPKDYLTERPIYDLKISQVSKFYEKNIKKLARLDTLLYSDPSNTTSNNPLLNYTHVKPNLILKNKVLSTLDLPEKSYIFFKVFCQD